MSEVHELVEAGQRSSGKHSLVVLWMIERSKSFGANGKTGALMSQDWREECRQLGIRVDTMSSIIRSFIQFLYLFIHSFIHSFIHYLSHSTFYLTKCLSKAL